MGTPSLVSETDLGVSLSLIVYLYLFIPLIEDRHSKLQQRFRDEVSGLAKFSRNYLLPGITALLQMGL